MRKRRKVELLAPAGNETGFYGAVSAGADAVYLGGNRFGARAYAENFTTESLTECIRYARLFGRKVYLTVNTLLKERELSELDEYLAPFYEAGLDAVIVQDLGVLRHIRERFPRLSLHVSTQMTLCSSYGAALLKQLGASRIVPARELGLRELTEIRRDVDIELETFIHGAMCYCYSGQCLFSSILGGRSGNRGRCAQPCRLPYGVRMDFPSEENGRNASSRESNSLLEEGYPLSLKDMCTIRHIPQLIEAGIDSFKIEGRMKKPEYTAGVTAVYRRFIDRYYEMRERLSPQEATKEYREELSASYQKEAEDLKWLTSLYIRSEVQDGYYFRRNGREMITLKSPAYSECDEAMLLEISERYLRNRLKLPVSVRAEFRTGQPAKVALRLRELEAEAVGDVVEAAKSRPITEENVKKQLGKLGDSDFCAADMEILVGEDAFYPLKQINELRRTAAERLRRQIAGDLRELDKTAVSTAEEAARKEPVREAGWVISVRTQEQLSAAADWCGENRKVPVVRLYVDGDLAVQNPKAVVSCCERLSGQTERWIALPYVLRNGGRDYMEQLTAFVRENGFGGFLARSLDEAGYLSAQEHMLPLRTDAGVYGWNREAIQELSELGAAGGCLPYELNGAEQRALLRAADDFSLEKMVYGRIPMMITANCVLRTTDRCEAAALHDKAAQQNGTALQNGTAMQNGAARNSAAQRGTVKLTDRYKKEFPVLRNCLHCMNIVYNSVPYSLRNDLSKWNGTEKRMDFTLETAAETKAVLNAFLNGAEPPFEEYTTGHEKRGVQ